MGCKRGYTALEGQSKGWKNIIRAGVSKALAEPALANGQSQNLSREIETGAA